MLAAVMLLVPLLLLAIVIPVGLDLYMPVPEGHALTAEKLDLGQRLFFDRRLSRDGSISCATCHDPARAFSEARARAIGVVGRQGPRNAPALINRGYGRAFFWDGRSRSLEQQVLDPIANPNEMDLPVSEAAARAGISEETLSQALARYVRSILSGNSRFDRFVNGDRSALTEEEQRGLSIFRGKGNCTACHPSQRQGYSEHPLFTDFTYDNIGVPRNWDIPANAANPVSPVSGASLVSYMPSGPGNVPSDAEYGYYDMGLCGPFQTDVIDGHPRPSFVTVTTLCGVFKVPSLRNVAITGPYFHNGVFSTLHQVVEWYVTRDINNNAGNNPAPVPAGPDGNPYFPVGTFYVNADGTPDLYEYNDLPVAFDANVNIGEVPYTPPKFSGGQSPTLTAAEIDAVVAFLCTLTDGYDPANPSAYNVPAQCRATASGN